MDLRERHLTALYFSRMNYLCCLWMHQITRAILGNAQFNRSCQRNQVWAV